MWYIILSAQGMCNRMYIAYIGFGKCTSGIERGVQHIPPRVDIAAVRICFVYIFKNELDCQKRIFSGAISGGFSDICLYRMGQGVHSGRSRDERRET